jgi:hypothetical protein
MAVRIYNGVERHWDGDPLVCTCLPQCGPATRPIAPPALLRHAPPQTLSGNLEGAQPNDIRVASGSFRCNGTAWPANLISTAYVVGGAICGARPCGVGGDCDAVVWAGDERFGGPCSSRDVCGQRDWVRDCRQGRGLRASRSIDRLMGAPSSSADVCRMYNRTCPFTSCQAPRTCDPASGTCSALVTFANGTQCPRTGSPSGSCLRGVCTGAAVGVGGTGAGLSLHGASRGAEGEGKRRQGRLGLPCWPGASPPPRRPLPWGGGAGHPAKLHALLPACPLTCCADLCAARNVTCPFTSCEAPRTCNPANGTCSSAPTPLSNGTLCPNGSCWGGVCMGEAGPGPCFTDGGHLVVMLACCQI